MKLKQKIKILCLAILGMCIGTTVSNAVIEIKPGTSPHVNITANTSFEYCYNMRSYSSSLGVNDLDPHLTTNADWAAAAYLGLSGYGYVRTKQGNAVTIGDFSYYSTTRNATGVMNMGNTDAFTASNMDKTGNYVSLIYKNRNSKYVEILDANSSQNNKKGLAITETTSWFSSATMADDQYKKLSVLHRRDGLLGFGSSDTTTYSRKR